MDLPMPNERESLTWGRFLRQAVTLAVMMLASLGLYLAVEWTRGRHATIVTQTEWDRDIPLRIEWVWVYMVPYLIGPIFVGLLSPTTFSWYIRRGIILVLLSCAIFAVLPTRTVRPTVDDLGEGLTADMYRNMIEIDGPAANAAPSLHVSLTCLLFWALYRDFRRWWPIALVGIAIVWLSTLLTHQHHIIDVVTGILLACAVAGIGKSDGERGASAP